MALIHNPEVLFLDEPTTGLDPASRTTVWEEEHALNRELGMTIFLTTQYLEEADVLAHRVGIINRGKLVAEGAPETLKRSIADDVLPADVVGDEPDALIRLSRRPGVCSVTRDGDRITLRVVDGPAILSPVALTLSGGHLEVRLCPHCLSAAYTWEEVSGRGRCTASSWCIASAIRPLPMRCPTCRPSSSWTRGRGY